MALYNALDKKLGLRDLDFTGGTNPSGLPDPSTAGPYTRQNVRQAIGLDSGVYTVTAADVTATLSTIQTAFTTSTIIGVSYEILRAGVSLAGGTVAFPASVGTWTLASGGGYTLTANDIVYWTAWIN